jgi:hypothetical protein
MHVDILTLRGRRHAGVARRGVVVLGSSVMRRLFIRDAEEETRGWTKLYNEEFKIFTVTTDIMVFKQRRIKCSMNTKCEIHTEFSSRTLKGRDHLEGYV